MMMQEDIKNKTMNEDLISGNFADNVNKYLIKRNIRLLLTIIILFSIYALFNLLEFYTLIFKSPYPGTVTRFTFYSLRIAPWTYLMSVIIAFIVWINYIKGHRIILLSFETDNVDLFNKGYAFINKAGIANIIGYAMLILGIIVRYTLKYF
jgi:hypothetical protein